MQEHEWCECVREAGQSASVHFKLSCIRCVSDIQVASTLVWSVERNGRSEDECVTPFSSRDQFVYHGRFAQLVLGTIMLNVLAVNL